MHQDGQWASAVLTDEVIRKPENVRKLREGHVSQPVTNPWGVSWTHPAETV